MPPSPRPSRINPSMGASPRFSYRFPSGWPGAGLLVMRVAVASAAASLPLHVLLAIDAEPSVPLLLLAGALVELCASLLLCVGLFSPYAELTLTIALLGVLGLHSTRAVDAD